jgi:DNA mismatch endonuclease (patch repair protein)
MSRVSRRNTSPEKIVTSFLLRNKIRFRKNVKALPGSPDIVIPVNNTIIFVHGCFWHGHRNCRLARRPTSNRSYWYKKIDENIQRDIAKARKLRRLGWRVLTIWQCQINSKQKSEKKLASLKKHLHKMSSGIHG